MSAQRLAVWNGERDKTSGGLKKADLIKNRHGRIVSKRKSEVARKLNNLGNFLAGKGKKKKQAEEKAPEPPKPKPKPKPKQAKPKPKPKPKQAKPKPKPKPKQPKPKPQSNFVLLDKIIADKEVRAQRRINKKTSGFHTDVDVSNIIPKMEYPKRRRKRVDYSKMGGALKSKGALLPSIAQLDKVNPKPAPRRRKKVRPRRVLDSLRV